jgi:phenylalanyl-tRNA synthetase alpha chain
MTEEIYRSTLAEILTRAKKAIEESSDTASLDQIRITYLGKKSQLIEMLKGVGELPPETRPLIGQLVNEIKQTLLDLFTTRASILKQQELDNSLSGDAIDVTLPGRGQDVGSLHPVSQARIRLEEIFLNLGFDIAEGPEIEDEFYNFEALNIPAHHPARASHDTFYFNEKNEKKLLRTHMSPVQIHYMQTHPSPFRMIAPGRVYRRDFDATHTPMFHQVEGMMVGESVSFAELKGMMIAFVRRFFDREDLEFRFRASYFPFTEPSAEMDIALSPGKWLEIFGCGMIHPNVFKAAGLDPSKHKGFAFGMGIDRLAMLYFKIEDLRLLFENDLRFLAQF